MRPLALHQLTALEAGPGGLVSIAEKIGCEQVCVFVHSLRAGAGRESGAHSFPSARLSVELPRLIGAAVGPR